MPAPLRLHRLHLQNFRGFADLDLALPACGPTVLAGVNGSGKTTLLDAIALLLTATITDEGARPEAVWLDLRHGATYGAVRADTSHGALQVEQRGDDRARALTPPISVPGQVIAYYARTEATPPLAREARTHRRRTSRALRPMQVRYPEFVTWFEQREDYENQEVRRRHPAPFVDPVLEATRRGVESLLSELSGVRFSGLRAHREPGRPTELMIDKSGIPLSLEALSGGEREVLVLFAGLQVKVRSAGNEVHPPESLGGVVLIDEVEQHFHPRWQRQVLPALCHAFPLVQFIVTTHSPQVLSRVPNENVILLRDFASVPLPGLVYGHTSDSILRVLDTTERPEDQARRLSEVARLLDRGRFEEASHLLDGLQEELGDTDPDVVHYRMSLALLT